MWISVHILKRPVLYIFRNLAIDQKQLQDDIVGTENYNFNIQFIKNLFEEFNNELQECFEETNVEYWKDYKLPELKDINSNDIINKLSNKEAINSNDIFCCLMNHSQLAKINIKFSEYISYNNELVNITTLVDESDLMSPTSSNDKTNDNDKKDSTACEILLAKIYKKVKYALHITGTAHSLLYNITSRLSDNTDIQIKISKVHKMKRSDDYYGLFNDSINFNTSFVNSWWDYQDKENHKKKYCYDIVEDYNINIKKIIEQILKRKTIKYNSFLISEEKIRANQFELVDKIIQDFPDLFIVIYHGNCLRLYLSKKYEKDIKRWSHWDSDQSSTSSRLYQSGGVYGSSIDTEKSEQLPNNYCYFNINTKILNIKFIYKLLRILFEKNDNPILCKTIITITGKYGERGYSFTSDDYDKYSLHLTDQYFVSHASLNCTDISQRLRLQGKYNDIELKNNMKVNLLSTLELKEKYNELKLKNNMNFSLWTTSDLQGKYNDLDFKNNINIALLTTHGLQEKYNNLDITLWTTLKLQGKYNDIELKNNMNLSLLTTPELKKKYDDLELKNNMKLTLWTTPELKKKYDDLELKNNMQLTLWTTPKLQDIIQNFYVKFIKEIEKFIMNCKNWEDIKDLLESIIDNGDFKFGEYMKYIDVSKKRKNLKLIKHFDIKNNGYKLIIIDDMEDEQIKKWCLEKNLPNFNCINNINEMKINEFIDKYGNYDGDIPLSIPKNSITNFDRDNLNEYVIQKFPLLNNSKLDRVVHIKNESINNDRYNGTQNAIDNNISYDHYITKRKPNTFNILIYDNYDNIHITITTNKKCLPKQTNNYIKKTPYIVLDDKIKYSILKKEYKDDNIILPNKYYWKTPDGWLYLYDNDKPEIISLDIVNPLSIKDILTDTLIEPLIEPLTETLIEPLIEPLTETLIEPLIEPLKEKLIEPLIETLIENDISLFSILCCKKTNIKNLRFGIKDIYIIYETWCKINDKKCLKMRKKFKEEFEKLNYKEEKSKGIDINNKSGKRGYNIMVKL
jgi:hypothetical protein